MAFAQPFTNTLFECGKVTILHLPTKTKGEIESQDVACAVPWDRLQKAR